MSHFFGTCVSVCDSCINVKNHCHNSQTYYVYSFINKIIFIFAYIYPQNRITRRWFINCLLFDCIGFCSFCLSWLLFLLKQFWANSDHLLNTWLIRMHALLDCWVKDFDIGATAIFQCLKVYFAYRNTKDIYCLTYVIHVYSVPGT